MKFRNVTAMKGKTKEILNKSKECFTGTPSAAPVKNRSVSLLDISDIPHLHKSRINISSETIGSSSSICKDSGFNQSESSLISEKLKDDENVDYKTQYFRLLEDMKFKDILITSLHESNHNLRLKIAEAENKITELRFKTQTHCKCCVTNSNPTEYREFESSLQLRYCVTPFARNDGCLTTPSPLKGDNVFPYSSSPIPDEPESLPSEDPVSKVKKWQNSVENLAGSYSKTSSSPETPQVPLVNNSTRPAPQPLPQSLSYMETSRALAETYCKRQESDHFSFQVFGDQSITVTPVDVLQRRMGGTGDQCTSGLEPRDLRPSSPPKEGVLRNLILRNQELKKRGSCLESSPAQKLKSHSLSMNGHSLLECLRSASSYAAILSPSISKLPHELNKIRSISDRDN